MNSTKLPLYILVWTILALVLVKLLPNLAQLFEPRLGLLVLALPWLVCIAGHGAQEVLAAFKDAFNARAQDLDSDTRTRSANILRKLGSLSLSAGVLAFFASAAGTLNSMAASGGQAHSIDMVADAPAAMLAPLLGFLLSAFVYTPLASSLEGLDSGLGVELED